MSVDSADGISISEFFTNLEKQFIGLCAFFVSRGPNYENFSPQSQEYILKNVEPIQHIALWVQDPEAVCEVEDTELFAFVIALARESIKRNTSNQILLHTDENNETTIRYNGASRQIHQ